MIPNAAYLSLLAVTLTYSIRPLVPPWASRGERAFCLRQVWKPGWVGCCRSSVLLSHPRSRSSLVFPLPCTLTSLCCKLYWQADEVPCVSGAQSIWFSAAGCGRELVLFQPFLWSWCSWSYRVWFCWRLSLVIASRRWWSFFRDFW